MHALIIFRSAACVYTFCKKFRVDTSQMRWSCARPSAAGIDAMEEAAKQLALLPFGTALSAAERDMAARAAFLRRYDRGQPIYEGGSGCLGLVCVVSGGVRAYLLSEEGREVTLFRLAPGDVCVLSASVCDPTDYV